MKIYCSKCGIELIHSRKAVPSKGHIFDLVDPHDCEGYAIKESDEPTVLQILGELKPLSNIDKVDKEATVTRKSIHGPGDLRKDMVTSSAPPGLLRDIKNMNPSDSDESEMGG